MNATLLKSVMALAPTGVLVAGSALWLRKARNVWRLLQLLGAVALLVVALAHICEALQAFASMNWGAPHSIGHYLDLLSAIVGLTVFPLGYLLDASTK